MHQETTAAKEVSFNSDDIMTSKSAGQLIEVLSAMMDNEDDDTWRSRSKALISALASPLVYLRDYNQLKLTTEVFNYYLDLDEAEKLAFHNHENYSKDPIFHLKQSVSNELNHATSSLRAFLLTTPGYDQNKVGQGQSQEAYENFGYVAMSLKRLLNGTAS